MINPRGESTDITTTLSETDVARAFDGFMKPEFTIFAIRAPSRPATPRAEKPKKFLQQQAWIWSAPDLLRYDFVECVHPLCASGSSRFQGMPDPSDESSVKNLKPAWAKRESEYKFGSNMTQAQLYSYWKKPWTARNCRYSKSTPDCNWKPKATASKYKHCQTASGDRMTPDACGRKKRPFSYSSQWNGTRLNFGVDFCVTGIRRHAWKESTTPFWPMKTQDGKLMATEGSRYDYRNCYVEHPKCDATTQAPVGEKRFDISQQANKCAKEMEAPSCLSKFTFDITTCNTCCCKDLVTTKISHSLVHGTKAACGVWFAAIDMVNRAAVSAQRYIQFMTYFGEKCYRDSVYWPSVAGRQGAK